MNNKTSDFQITFNDNTDFAIVSAKMTIGDKFITLTSFNGNNIAETVYLPIERIQEIVEYPNNPSEPMEIQPIEDPDELDVDFTEILSHIDLAREEKILDWEQQLENTKKFLSDYVDWERRWYEPNHIKVGDVVKMNWKAKVNLKLVLPTNTMVVKNVSLSGTANMEDGQQWHIYWLQKV
jgi:hypothetical protein